MNEMILDVEKLQSELLNKHIVFRDNRLARVIKLEQKTGGHQPFELTLYSAGGDTISFYVSEGDMYKLYKGEVAEVYEAETKRRTECKLDNSLAIYMIYQHNVPKPHLGVFAYKHEADLTLQNILQEEKRSQGDMDGYEVRKANAVFWQNTLWALYSNDRIVSRFDSLAEAEHALRELCDVYPNLEVKKI